jgi:pectate lyase
VFRGPLPLLTVTLALAATAAACGDSRAQAYTKVPIDCSDTKTMIGYAEIAGATGPTTGGDGTTVAPVEVTTLRGLTDALADPQPLVIVLTGTITIIDKVRITTNDKSIIGVGANSGFIGGGIELSDVDNIILRNLKISKVQAAGDSDGDAIRLTNATHVWIDHCDLSSERNVADGIYDGLVDVSHASDYVTVSWTLLHDHRDTSLVGHSESAEAEAEDTGHLRVSYHHNHFFNIDWGVRVRFGTIHVFSNRFEDVGIFGVASETLASAKVEKNIFERVATPITTDYLDAREGTAFEEGSQVTGSGANNITMRQDFVVPYSFTPDSTSGTLTLVSNCAGTGKITLP